VKQQPHRIAELEKIFHAVSDPDHADYGKHLTHIEVIEYQRPTAEHLHNVRTHLANYSVRESLAGDKLVVTLGDSDDNRLFQPLPPLVIDAVDMVTGGIRSPRSILTPARKRKVITTTSRALASAADPQACLQERVDPTCIRAAYGLNDAKASAGTKASQAVIVNQAYKPADIAKFLAKYKLPAMPIPIKNVGTLSGTAGDEASLDLEYITSTGLGVPTTWVYIDGHVANPFASWITWASNKTDVPLVHSLSVGEPEGEIKDFVDRMNKELMALGTRGVSIIFASGDSGYTKEQKFGSSSIYVTSVGGVFNGELGGEPLQVDTESTGGFSTLSANPIQPWQTAAVAAYLKTKGSRPAFNSSRRACPDLSIYDFNYDVIQNGRPTALDGTSCAAPVLSGMVSLLNDARLAAGKPPMGFLNYFLYQVI
jgi:tripeptidyl-peptidase-1